METMFDNSKIYTLTVSFCVIIPTTIVTEYLCMHYKSDTILKLWHF